MNGELITVSKLSNGLQTGDEGYVYVSLATLYFSVSAVGNHRRLFEVYLNPVTCSLISWP